MSFSQVNTCTVYIKHRWVKDPYYILLQDVVSFKVVMIFFWMGGKKKEKKSVEKALGRERESPKTA